MDHKPNDLEALVTHLEELTESFEEDHTPEFLAHLTHEAPEVRAVAVRGLWESDPNEVLAPLSDIARQDPDPDVRATAVSVLGRYIYEGLLDDDPREEGAVDPERIARVRSYLESVLYDEAQPVLVRRRALEGLAFDPGPEEISLMEKWFKDRSPELRMSALFAMGRAGFDQFDKLILRGLDDREHDVRREAIRAVGAAGIEAGVSRLTRFINGPDRELMFETIAALGEIGGDDAVELLEELSLSDDEEVAELAATALEEAAALSMIDEFGEDEEDDDESLDVDEEDPDEDA